MFIFVCLLQAAQVRLFLSELVSSYDVSYLDQYNVNITFSSNNVCALKRHIDFLIGWVCYVFSNMSNKYIENYAIFQVNSFDQKLNTHYFHILMYFDDIVYLQ